jgi:LPXTG-motif cell wall-anchored protein
MGLALLARVAAGLAGAGLALTLAAPAAATEEAPPVELDSAYQQTAADEHPQRCAEGTEETDPHVDGVAAGEAGWYFTVSGGEIDILEVRFAPGGDEDGGYEELSGSRGDDDPDNPVIFHDAGAYVVSPLEWVLVTASATVTGGEAPTLVVAHTCVVAPEDDAGSSAAAGPEDDQAAGGDVGDRRGLPVTGAQVGGLVVLGCGLLSAGFAMTAVRRRRNLSHLLEL